MNHLQDPQNKVSGHCFYKFGGSYFSVDDNFDGKYVIIKHLSNSLSGGNLSPMDGFQISL